MAGRAGEEIGKGVGREGREGSRQGREGGEEEGDT